MEVILKIDADLMVPHLSKNFQMKITFVTFAILFILGMIQVKSRKLSVKNDPI